VCRKKYIKKIFGGFMKVRNLFVAMLIAVFAAGMAFAEEGAVASEKKADTSAIVGGQVWVSWGYNMTKDVDDRGHFHFDRIHLKVFKQITDMWSTKVVLEGNAYHRDTITGETLFNYGMAVRECSVNANLSIGPVDLEWRGGMVELPYTCYVARLAGTTRVFKNAISDGAYDGGIAFGGTYDKLVGAYFSVTHGQSIMPNSIFSAGPGVTKYNSVNTAGGYMDIAGGNANNAYEIGGRVEVTPIESLHVFGFFNIDAGYTALGDHPLVPGDQTVPIGGYNLYDDPYDYAYGMYGGGVAWKDSNYRVGFNMAVYHKDSTVETPGLSAPDDMKINAWANANLDQFIGMPISVYFNMNYLIPDNGDKVAELGFGAGYDFGGVDVTGYFTMKTEEETDTKNENIGQKPMDVKFVFASDF